MLDVNKYLRQITLPQSLEAQRKLGNHLLYVQWGGTHFMFFITVFTEVRGGIKPSLYEGQIQRHSGVEVKSMHCVL